MEATKLEPMSIGQILDRSFRLYRQNFVRFIAIVAVVQVPISLIVLAVQHLVVQGGDPPAAVFGGAEATGLGVGLIILFLALLAQSLSNAALLKSISESYLGQDVTVGAAYRFVLPKLVTIIAAGLLVGLVTTLGLVLLIVPGIIFSLWYALTTQAIVVENLKATRGMKRSKALVSGNLGKLFLVLLVVALITWIGSWLFGRVGQLISGQVAANNPSAALLINQVFSLVGQVLVMPISAGAMILLYYDLRIRKEGFDLEMLARSLGSEEAAPDAGPGAPTPVQ